MVPAFIDRSNNFFRTSNGDAKEIDATMIVYGDINVQAGDKLEMDSLQVEEYFVFSQAENYDANGTVRNKSLRLVKKLQTV
jgi:hypothetical protein